MKVITDSNYVEVLESSIPVLLDVYTPFCGPCRQMMPAIEKLALEFAGRVLVAKLDGSEDLGVADELGVRKVPCLIAFRDGIEIGRRTGFVAEDALRQWISYLEEGN